MNCSEAILHALGDFLVVEIKLFTAESLISAVENSAAGRTKSSACAQWQVSAPFHS